MYMDMHIYDKTIVNLHDAVQALPMAMLRQSRHALQLPGPKPGPGLCAVT